MVYLSITISYPSTQFEELYGTFINLGSSTPKDNSPNKKNAPWQCKGQLLFLQPFYLKLQIIAKNWNNRECDDFGTRTSLTWSPSKAFCGVSTLAFHQDEDTPGAVLQILGFAEERVGGISSSFVGCQQQPDHSRKRRPCYQFQICPHAHLFSQACG